MFWLSINLFTQNLKLELKIQKLNLLTFTFFFRVLIRVISLIEPSYDGRSNMDRIMTKQIVVVLVNNSLMIIERLVIRLNLDNLVSCPDNFWED